MINQQYMGVVLRHRSFPGGIFLSDSGFKHFLFSPLFGEDSNFD